MTDTWDGRPQNPERGGAHELKAAPGADGKRIRFVALWAYGRWFCGLAETLPAVAVEYGWQYVGPCLTPAEVEAQVEAARREEREACAALIDCGCDIRDAVLARLESKGERYAAYLCQQGSACCALQASAIRARGDA